MSAGETSPTPPGSLPSDLARLVLRPQDLFAELPRVNHSGAALVVLLLLNVAYGLGLLSTGVIDYEIDSQTQREIAKQVRLLPGDEDSDQLNRTVETIEKTATFNRLMSRVTLLVGGPVGLLVGVATVAGLLYVAVALRGEAKADFRVLAGVVIFATFALVPGMLLRLYLVSQLGTTRVEISLAALTPPAQTGLGLYLLLRRLDPFHLWYWALVALGVSRSGQLSVRRAVVVVTLLAILCALLQMGGDLMILTDLPEKMRSPEGDADL